MAGETHADDALGAEADVTAAMTVLRGAATREVEVVIDRRNFPIYEKHLSAAGYVFERRDGLMSKILVLTVPIDSLVDVNEVVHAANIEAGVA